VDNGQRFTLYLTILPDRHTIRPVPAASDVAPSKPTSEKQRHCRKPVWGPPWAGFGFLDRPVGYGLHRGFLKALDKRQFCYTSRGRPALIAHPGPCAVRLPRPRITWVKLNTTYKHGAAYFTGLGYWTRANPEQCLLATRGKPSRRAKDVKRLVVEKRREHSRKLDCVRERIEKLRKTRDHLLRVL
jgi:hypothetical protein